MSLRHITTFVATLGSLIAGIASAQHIAPNALLTIDQNRTTVVDRIVTEWGYRLASSKAGIGAVQLREILTGLRADDLLAASLAGSVEGLRDVVSGALVHTDAAVSPGLMHTKSLGDVGDDLVYTPINPCRIVDTRLGGGGFLADDTERDWNVARPGGNFTDQGGANNDCGIPAAPAAALANLAVTGSSQPGVMFAWAFNQPAPVASVLNYAGGQTIANAVIVPLAQSLAKEVSVFVSTGTHVVVDVLGYFRRPTNYSGTHTITGFGATDSGGFGNTAGGSASFAAGSLANANHDGCFVWGDASTSNDVRCEQANRFVVRATNGIYMFSGGSMQGNYTGVQLSPG